MRQHFSHSADYFCSHGPTAFLLANNGSVWVLGKAAPYWSYNPAGGQNFDVAPFEPALWVHRVYGSVFVDIGYV
jgi:hypothetical protein